MRAPPPLPSRQTRAGDAPLLACADLTRHGHSAQTQPQAQVQVQIPMRARCAASSSADPFGWSAAAAAAAASSAVSVTGSHVAAVVPVPQRQRPVGSEGQRGRRAAPLSRPLLLLLPLLLFFFSSLPLPALSDPDVGVGGLLSPFAPVVTDPFNGVAGGGDEILKGEEEEVGVVDLVSLGWLGPAVGSALSQFLAPSLYAAHLAVAAINEQPRLLPRTRLQLLVGDTRNDPTRTIAETVALVQRGDVAAIVGEYFSSLSALAAQTANPYAVPVVSPGATSTDFTEQHDTNFPFFARSIPHNGLQARQMAQLCLSQNWKRVALLFTTDTYGSSGAGATATELSRLGIRVLVSSSFSVGAPAEDVAFALGRLAQSQARIILWWGTAAEFWKVMRAGAAMDPPLFGGEGYQWILSDGSTGALLDHDAQGERLADISRLARGALGMYVTIDYESKGYTRFHSMFHNSPTNYSTLVTPGMDRAARINQYAVFTWDAVMMLGRALHHCIEVLGLDPRRREHRPAFYKSITNTTLMSGASGLVSLDAKGDRQGGYAVYNYQSDSAAFEPVGVVEIDGRFRLRTNATIEWMGTRGRVADMPARVVRPIETRVERGVLTATLVLLCATALLMAAMVWLRDHPVLRASSPPFLHAMCLGVMALASSVCARTVENGRGFSMAERNSSCVADFFLANLGYVLIVGALLVKTYRVRAIFLQRTLGESKGARRGGSLMQMRRDWQLALALLALLCVESAMLVALQLSAPLHVELVPNNSSPFPPEDYYSCTSRLMDLFVPVTLAARFALLLLTAVCVYSVRDVPSQFNETRQLLLTVYNLLFLSSLLPAIDASLHRGKDNALAAYSVCVFVICALTLAIMFAPKLAAILHMRRRANARNGAAAGGGGIGGGSGGFTEGTEGTQHPTVSGSGSNRGAIEGPPDARQVQVRESAASAAAAAIAAAAAAAEAQWRERELTAASPTANATAAVDPAAAAAPEPIPLVRLPLRVHPSASPLPSAGAPDTPHAIAPPTAAADRGDFVPPLRVRRAPDGPRKANAKAATGRTPAVATTATATGGASPPVVASPVHLDAVAPVAAASSATAAAVRLHLRPSVPSGPSPPPAVAAAGDHPLQAQPLVALEHVHVTVGVDHSPSAAPVPAPTAAAATADQLRGNDGPLSGSPPVPPSVSVALAADLAADLSQFLQLRHEFLAFRAERQAQLDAEARSPTATITAATASTAAHPALPPPPRTPSDGELEEADDDHADATPFPSADLGNAAAARVSE